MSAFHNIRFPSDISFKALGGPAFSTKISELTSGKERRNINRINARHKYEIDFKEISQKQVNEVLSFFMARQGRAYGFRLKDWNDFEVNSQIIAIGDGNKTEFQLIKDYDDGAYTFTRKIFKPVESSVAVYVDDVLQQTGYSVDYNKGAVTFDNAPLNEEVITADFQFDVPVRFAADELVSKTESYGKRTVRNIELIEIVNPS